MAAARPVGAAPSSLRRLQDLPGAAAPQQLASRLRAGCTWSGTHSHQREREASRERARAGLSLGLFLPLPTNEEADPLQ